MNEGSSSWNLLRIHGYLALSAFVVVLPLSAIVVAIGSRWDVWLIAHVALVTIGTLLAIASIAFGIAGSAAIGHLATTHQILGTSFVAFMGLGLITGIYISVRWRPLRSNTPTRDKVHWWVGRLLIASSFLLSFNGLVAGGWPIWSYIFTTISWFLWVFVYGISLADVPNHHDE